MVTKGVGGVFKQLEDKKKKLRAAMAAATAMENLKRAVRAGDMKALSAGRLDELRLELNEGVLPDVYTALHWACHYRNAEVRRRDPPVIAGRGWGWGSCSGTVEWEYKFPAGWL